MNTGVVAEGATQEKVGEEVVGRPRDEGNGCRSCICRTSMQILQSHPKCGFELRGEATLR